MAGPIGNLGAYSDALVVLGTAGVVVPLVRRLGISPILGYLGAGALLGPLGLGTFKDQIPALYWLTVVDGKNVSAFAELGIVFLLFLIGLELSLERLITMRRLVFGLGSLQVAISTAIIAGITALAGYSNAASVIIGSCLALSSTAIVLEVLSNQRRISTAVGRTSFSILLAQDLAVVPILLFVSILANGTGGKVLAGLGLAVLNASIALGVIVIVGRLLLRPLFRLVAATDTAELFVATTLFVIVGSAVVAGLSGMSMALGAFVAGLLLAESEFRKAIEVTIEPFKGLLLGLFFFTVGMTIDFRELAHQPVLLLACAFGLIALKATIVAALGWVFRVPQRAAIETGLLLGPGGEFAFVVIGVAVAAQIVAPSVGSFTLAVTSITMALIPVLGIAARRFARRFEEPKKAPDPSLLLVPQANGHARAIVVGHGRVGQVVCDLLDVHQFPYLATDRDPAAVIEYRQRGREVYYGDATSPAFLKSCGLLAAPALIVTIHDQAAIDQIVRVAREMRPDLLIVSRARDAVHARHLYSIGVSDAVPETIEASLQLSEAALVGLSVPTGPVIASIHEKRDEFRRALRDAAGGNDTHAIRPKEL
ncbi:MAG TPA: cation:proton antiporter [Hyphomicrobiaceae bacterium]|nr:cation:proton antiporter [Hyphomicrobiaceae bacterium]